MAPEVFWHQSYDARVDVYSLGLVLYRCLNHNRPPFVAQGEVNYDNWDRANTFRLKGQAIPPILELDDRFNEILLRACAYKPEKRYSSAAELRDALLDYARVRGINWSSYANKADAEFKERRNEPRPNVHTKATPNPKGNDKVEEDKTVRRVFSWQENGAENGKADGFHSEGWNRDNNFSEEDDYNYNYKEDQPYDEDYDDDSEDKSSSGVPQSVRIMMAVLLGLAIILGVIALREIRG